MKDTDLVKCAQLDLLVELKRICDENEINYFLVGGTLIGAIRHNGFIPWDDDIDVGMLREDYEQFITACKTQLNQEYGLYDWYIDAASPIPFLKLKIKGTHYREGLAENTNVNDEIFIDVFPFDNAPDSIILRNFQGVEIYLLKKILLLRCGYTIEKNSGVAKKAAYKVLNTVSKVRSIKKWKLTCDRIMKRYNSKLTTHVVNMCGVYSYKKEMKKRTILEKTILHNFEMYDMCIPAEYDQYLREVYGDYMQLPPESQREGRHQVTTIDLGDYRVLSHLITD